MKFEPTSGRPLPIDNAQRVKALPSSSNATDAIDGATRDRSIGELLKTTKQLSEQQIEQILQCQLEQGLRFGEAAIAMNLASRDDVLWALSQQFQYPYAAVEVGRHHPELIVASQPFGDQAEAFRELRSQLMMGVLGVEEPRRALAVVSPDRSDGKTFIAANLAVSFSQLKGHTLLIDADMRAPRQHAVFGIETHGGLSNILSGRADADVIRPVKDLPNLFVLPVGAVPPNPLELVQRSSFLLLVRELLKKFDYVIVDTPAGSHGPDARVIAATCGAALTVGRVGTSRLSTMDRFVRGLAKGNVKLAGVVMNER